MKRIFLIASLSFLITHSFGQTEQQSCASFKKGEFAYRDSADHIIEVTRKENRQQEYDKKNKIITKFKIRWIADCEYELTQIWSNSKAKRKGNRSVTKVVITKANGNASYEYNCGCKDRESKDHNGTMVRLED